MRKIYFLLITFCYFASVNAQIINFPDANFKAKLLQASGSNYIAQNLAGNYFKIDANNDGEIQVAEAIEVKVLSVSGSNISNLTGISYFNGLTELNCDGNQLTSLSINNLTNLITLNYSGNHITSINLSNLSDLKELYCGANQITSLSSIVLSPSANLVELHCNNNLITSADFSNFTSLQYLGIENNLLTSLNVNSLTNLFALWCGGNQLTFLNVNNLPQLGLLAIDENPITSIDISNLNLGNFKCSGTPLVEIDISNSVRLQDLNISNCTQLKRIFMKNGVGNGGNYYAVNLPNLEYICADAEDSNIIQFILMVSGSSEVTVNSYCSFVPGGEYYVIQGNAKYDSNSNGCDTSDSAIPNLRFNITNGTISGSIIANASGNYSIPVQAGTYTISPVFESPNYFSASPSVVNVSFPIQASPFNQNFCVTTNGIHSDLEVMLAPTIPARPGFNAVYKLIYKNKGTNVQSGTLNLNFDDAVLDFVSANPVATNQIVNNISWDFTNLQPFEKREITLTLNVNSPTETPAVNIGDILHYMAIITSAATDETPNDNTSVLNQIVVNSYDPNDKTCLEGATISPSEVGKYVHYMIRFENTGTANAQNIVVKDMIDTDKFDINSLVPIKGSHSFVTNIISGNKVEFIFENINLPFDDANNDGYVAFKIKTKPTLVAGNTFSNNASIYFDYNFPIVTNTATTTIQALSTQDFGFGQYFSLYPNPVKDVLNIETKQTIEVTSINIYNQLGQLVLVVPNAQDVSKVDVSALSSGNYFIKINSDKGVSNAKFIKK